MILVNAVKIHYSFTMKFKLSCFLLVLLCARIIQAKEAELSLDQSRSKEQDSQLSFSRIVIGEFKNSRMTSNSQQDFCNYLAGEFNLKSYWDSQCGNVVKVGDQESSPGTVAILTGEWQGPDLILRLKSKNQKYELATWTTKITPPEETLVKPAAEQVAAFLISEIQMIAFVMKVRKDEVLINIGQRKSVRVGQTFKVFDYTEVNDPFNGAQKEIGTIKVKKVVDPERAIAEILEVRDNESLSSGAKIKIDDASFIKSNLADRVSHKAWIGFGAQLMTIQSSTNALSSVQTRNYNFNYSPFFDLSFGSTKTMGHVFYGSASGPSADISYLEMEANQDVLDMPFNDGICIVSLGLNLSQFSANNHVTPALFENSQRISPLIDIRLQYEPKPRILFYLGAKFLYPAFTSSQLGGAQFFSYAAEPSVGSQFQMSAASALEILARTRYFAINFSGQTGVRETQTAFVSRYIYFFR